MEQFNLGLELKETGMAQVLSHNLGWQAQALCRLRQFCATCAPSEEFTIDDFRRVAWDLPQPSHFKAWGAFWNVAAKHKIIIGTGRYRNSPVASRHAAPNQIWVKGT